MQKAITDFIIYAQDNITWFALNFVLVLMPIVCMFLLNTKAENLDIPGAQMSYTSLLSIVCAVNFCQFLARPQIHITEKYNRIYEEEEKKEEHKPKTNLGAALASLKSS